MTAPRVLVADDEPISRAVVGMRLSLLGATVVEAEDGISALAKLRDGEFALAIIDLEMPKVDGFALLACIRVNPMHKNLPIIVLTGSEDQPSIERAHALGANFFLKKPLNWEVLAGCIRPLLAGASEAVPDRNIALTAR